MVSNQSSIWELWGQALAAKRACGLATLIEKDEDSEASVLHLGAKILLVEGSDPIGTLGNELLDRAVVQDTQGLMERGSSSLRHYGPEGQARQGEVAVFIEIHTPAPKLLVFGAVDFSAALAKQGKLLGYEVVVCDARRTFATHGRFPMADEVVVDWPDRYISEHASQLGPRDAICILTHDPKFDVPAIKAALATKVGYIGAMGSRRTHEKRVRQLLEEGVEEAALERVKGPIGLAIGARTPEEVAVSIAAEIILERSLARAPGSQEATSAPGGQAGRVASNLSKLTGSVHLPEPPSNRSAGSTPLGARSAEEDQASPSKDN